MVERKVQLWRRWRSSCLRVELHTLRVSWELWDQNHLDLNQISDLLLLSGYGPIVPTVCCHTLTGCLAPSPPPSNADNLVRQYPLYR
jgi:hypothetical protein